MERKKLNFPGFQITSSYNFSENSKAQAEAVSADKYCKTSGHKVNMQKSVINLHPDRKESMKDFTKASHLQQ